MVLGRRRAVYAFFFSPSRETTATSAAGASPPRGYFQCWPRWHGVSRAWMEWNAGVAPSFWSLPGWLSSYDEFGRERHHTRVDGWIGKQSNLANGLVLVDSLGMEAVSFLGWKGGDGQRVLCGVV